MTQPRNIDAQEIAKFNRVAQLWWDANGKMGMLHVINPLRSQFIIDQAKLDGAKVVDVGCGGGILTETLAQAGAQVTGIDLSEMSLAVARDHAKKQALNIDYRLQTVESLAQQNPASYDVVTCLEMLEHVPDPAAIIKACSQLLKPGGYAIFSTINRNFKAWLFAIVGGEYILRILPRGTHQYKKLIRPQQMRTWAQQAELNYLRSASLIYTPWRKSFRLAPDKEDVNYLASFKKPK